jgi:hypothetical protein
LLQVEFPNMARVRERANSHQQHTIHQKPLSSFSWGLLMNLLMNQQLSSNQVRYGTGSLNGKSVSCVHPPSTPLWCVLVVAVGFTLTMRESARGFIILLKEQNKQLQVFCRWQSSAFS